MRQPIPGEIALGRAELASEWVFPGRRGILARRRLACILFETHTGGELVAARSRLPGTSELAFRSTTEGLRDYLKGILHTHAV